MSSKEALRLEVRARLLAMSSAARAAASQRICGSLLAEPVWKEARLVCAFFPLPSEPQIHALWERSTGTAFCFPRVNGSHLELIRVDQLELLQNATWRLNEPQFSTLPLVPAAEVDLLLVPGIAFTAAGARLGRGGGFYDRLLASTSLRAVKIGVCFDVQLAAELPLDAHDQRVDRVVTESGFQIG